MFFFVKGRFDAVNFVDKLQGAFSRFVLAQSDYFSVVSESVLGFFTKNINVIFGYAENIKFLEEKIAGGNLQSDVSN